MLIKYFILFSGFLLLFVNIDAQQHYQKQQPEMPAISGTITDKKGTAIPYASVAVYNSLDSTLVTGAATDDKGKFFILAKPGNYFLKITFLSYQEKIIPKVQLTKEGIDIGTITLKQGTITLDEVKIKEKKYFMELELDKRVFNVGKDIENIGSNAAEILDNVPSVSVDVDGNVSLRGSENVRILIDGRPSGSIGVNSSEALRQLQGNMIESIEVITNPSARYDAEGEVGIINIVLKKERRQGLNGFFEATGGYPERYRGTFSLNYRKKGINLFTSYGIYYRNTPGSGFSRQEFFGDSIYSYERLREHTRGRLSHTLRLGTDMFFDEHNTLTISGKFKYSNGTNDALLTYLDYDSNDVLTNTVTRTEEENEKKQDMDIEINYLKTFSQKGRKWTVDLQWEQDDDRELAELFEKDDIGSTPVTQRSSNTEDAEKWLFQTDYIHPFGKHGKFETGLKSTLRIINNDYLVEEQAADESWFALTDFDNNFIYKENIHAGYLMGGNKISRFSYQLGLRIEYSDITTELTRTNVANHRTYSGLFPNVHTSYEIDSTNTLQLSYSRRISRPRFRHLLPFFTFSDSRIFFSGNPDLDAEHTNSFELGHLKYFENGSMLSSIYYRHRTGLIERITTVDSSGFTSIFPINLSTQNAFGLEFNINYDLSKWWRLNGSFNFYRAITDGKYESQDLNSDTYSWSTRGSSKITLFKKVEFKVSFRYHAPRETTQGKRLAMYNLNTGLSLDILKGNGTIIFSVKDLLNTHKWRSITYGENFNSESEFQWHSRQFRLSFTYRLKQKKQRDSKDEGIDGDEMEF